MIDFKKLAEPFNNAQIEWRAQTVNPDAGWALMVPYITARAVQSRLDDVCGVENWKQIYREIRSHSKDGETVNMLCGIAIRCKVDDSSEWVTKFDGAQPTDIEGFKGSISGAFRRAAVSWGIGRFLYDLEPAFVSISTVKDNSKERMNFKRVWYYYDKPKLPKWCADEEETDSDLNDAIKITGLEATSWDELLVAMKKDDRIALGKTASGADIIKGVQQWEESGKQAKEICSQMIKYFK